MIRAFISSLRIGFAMACVGVSLLLVGQWLGLVPDVDRARAESRQRYCEALAIQAASSVRSQHWMNLESVFETLVACNEDLLSVGFRSDLGVLQLDTGHHDAYRSSSTTPTDLAGPGFDQQISRNTSSMDAMASFEAVQTIDVPITLNRRHWGHVEFCYKTHPVTIVSGLTNMSLFPMVCFFFTTGIGAYGMLTARILGVFKKAQVVPDRVRQALDTLAEGLLVLDEKGKIVLANQAFNASTAGEKNAFHGVLVDDLNWVIPSGASDSEAHPWRASIEDGAIRTGCILRYQLDNGEVRIFSLNSAPIGGDGESRGAVVTCRDVTHIEAQRAEQEKMLSMLRSSRDEIRRKNRELETLATQDSLTGCLNRRAFFERFESLWESAKTTGGQLGCMMIDNDHFKAVNDTYGHHIGDEVLRQVSRVIKDLHDARHLVCRYGGEEFCIVMAGMDFDAVAAEAERTRKAIEAIRLAEPSELRLTASVGVSELQFEPSDPQELINQADECLYVAKRRGRNCVVTYEPGLEQSGEDVETESTQHLDQQQDSLGIPFQAVTGLLGALSYRDSDTAEHSCRVAEICVRVADGLLNQRDSYRLEIAALLHDVGKIGVPDHVLLKPGRLTTEEWILMSRHDEISADIIDGTFSCPELVNIIRCHHAFFGGGGMEEGLPVGKAIPLAARILTIADSYDAIVSDRIYRKGRSHAEAVAELRRCAGTQFDPDLVETFIEKIHPEMLSRDLKVSGISKQVALQIGTQVKQMIDAIDNRDERNLLRLAQSLSQLTQTDQSRPITEGATLLEQQLGSENSQWDDVLVRTHDLLQLCRDTRATYLGDSTERNLAVLQRLTVEADAS